MPRRTDQSWEEQVQDERNRRIGRELAKYSVHHMNDTKWREVLSLLNSPECEVKRVRLKFIDSEHVIDSSGRFFLMDRVCDGFPGPFEYREIEWLEVPERYFEQIGYKGTPPTERKQDPWPFQKAVDSLGQLPIRDSDNGFRIIGYE